MLYQINLLLIDNGNISNNPRITAYCYAPDLDGAQARALRLFLGGFANNGYLLQSAIVEPAEVPDDTIII
jgi:hypothetical protein